MEDKNTQNIQTNVELAGNYEEIMEILEESGHKNEVFTSLLNDFEIILETIESIDGGTKSRIVTELPSNLSIDIEAEELVPILRVFENYELVTLDGNTWNPGSKLK